MELIVIYDVATTDEDGARRLRQVAKVCEQYGVRVQKSVFECRITESSHERLIAGLLEVIDSETDRLTIYEIPGTLRAIRTEFGRDSTKVDGPWIF